MDGHFQKACGITQECLRHVAQEHSTPTQFLRASETSVSTR